MLVVLVFMEIIITIPINENHDKNPINPYGKTKVEKDNLATKFSNEKCSIIGLRYFNVFGKGQTGTYAGVITKFLDCLKNKTSPIIYGDGNQIRDFISVEDIATANLQAMLTIYQKFMIMDLMLLNF